ncbi:LON peptidase substrate-binding domain-containing protein [Verrucomicrobiales bacterium]|nr:LON peptidase substrate-binding domain-containing protein [Verrucomicrobiales bacterium]
MRIPEKLPIIALPNTYLFPSTSIPLHIFENKYQEMLSDVISGDRMFCIGTIQKSESVNDYLDNIYPYSTAGLLRACVVNENGTANLILEGIKRIKITELENHKPYKIGRVQVITSNTTDEKWVLSADEKIKSILLGDSFSYQTENSEMNINQILENLGKPEDTADFVSQYFISDQLTLRKLLSLESIDERLEVILKFLLN